MNQSKNGYSILTRSTSMMKTVAASKPLLVAVLLVCGTTSGVAENAIKVVVTGSASFTSDLTIKEAEEHALHDAYAKAVAQVVGVDVQSVILRQKSEATGPSKEDSLYFDLFSQVNRVVSYGRVVDHRILDEYRIVQERLPSGGTARSMVVRVECSVVREEEKPDPGFSLQMNLNKDVFIDDGGTPDELLISLKSSLDAYITLFDVYQDTVVVLFPNERASNNHLRAGVGFEFPTGANSTGKMTFVPRVPDGRRHSVESVFVIATRDSVVFAGGKMQKGEGTFIATRRTVVDDLNLWLSGIPPSRRTEAWQPFEVRAKLPSR